MKALRTLDAFGRTLEDVKVKTSFGGTLTLISFALIFTLTVVEFVDYRRVHLEPRIIVDKSRGERLVVHMNITFPRVPCYRASTSLSSPPTQRSAQRRSDGRLWRACQRRPARHHQKPARLKRQEN